MATRQYLVTIHGSENMTAHAWQIHTILTSRDNIQPAERVEVVAVGTWPDWMVGQDGPPTVS